jgi:hypothetical protein
MTLHAPTYAGGFASPERGMLQHRNVWKGVVGAWLPSAGATGLTLRDHSGRGNHGTINGATAAEAWADTPRGLTFDGSDDYTRLPDETLPVGVNALTVSMWCKADDTAAEYRAFAYNTNDVYISLIVNRGGTANRIQGLVHASGSTAVTTDAYAVTDLIHIAITATAGDRFDLYLNGILAASDTSIGAFSVTSGTPTYNNIGAARNNSIPFLGTIDDIAIWSRDLPPSEISLLHSLGPGGMYRRKRRVIAAPAAGRINSLIGVGGGMIGYGGGMIGRGY